LTDHTASVTTAYCRQLGCKPDVKMLYMRSK